MTNAYFIQNVTIINEGLSAEGSLFVKDGIIARIYKQGEPVEIPAGCTAIDATGLWLLPGVIDTHVHFREPGATHKADIASETRAAAAGGVTSFIDLPNTVPATTTIDLVRKKMARAAEVSLINYSFYLGATNENIDEIKRIDPREIGGVKLFMGSSTGNMLVNDERMLAALFAESPVLIAAHCEDEATIQRNLADYKARYGDTMTTRFHPLIRTEEACMRSTEYAMQLATKYNARLHVLHLTTAKETTLFSKDSKITAEACIPHLWFCDDAYERLGNFVKCNPAIKTAADREALRSAVNKGIITTIGTDHAPHTRDEKQQPFLTAPSGMPSIQFGLPLMLELCRKGVFTPEIIVERMCHAPAMLYGIEQRGFIREGYYADLALVNPAQPWAITNDLVLSKCGWTPYHEIPVNTCVTHTFVNGNLIFEDGKIHEQYKGKKLTFA